MQGLYIRSVQRASAPTVCMKKPQQRSRRARPKKGADRLGLGSALG